MMGLISELHCEIGRGWGGGYPSFGELLNL